MDDPIEIRCKVLRTHKRLSKEGEVVAWSTVQLNDPADGLPQVVNIAGDFSLGAELSAEVRLLLPTESEAARG